MAKAQPLNVEQLEDRVTPAAFNVPWPEAPELTLSFAPDRTQLGDQASSLFRTLDSRLPTAVWQREMLRAFQTWAVEANINVGLVPDGGQPFGTLGLKQGDPRFGDIRIGARSMASDVLAVSNPFDPFVANTWVGDVFLNSSFPFGVGDQGGSFDLYSVLLHEAGHVLGIDHSSDPASPMYPDFNLHKTGLTTADITALHTLYGARPPDALEGTSGNDTFATATVLGLSGSGGTPSSVAVQADITTHQDVDIYRLRVPTGTTALDIKVTVAGISLLLPRLTVYDAAGNVVGSAVASDPLNNNLSLRIDHPAEDGTYYVKVEGATSDVFGIGRYRLNIDAHSCPTDPSYSGPSSYPAPTGPGNSSGPANPMSGIKLLATTPGYVEHTYYETADTISPASPVHTYQVRSADLGPEMTNVMTVVVYSLTEPGGRFRVNVLDDQGNRVDATVIVDRDGNLTVQVPNVLSNRDYFVQVLSANPDATGELPYEIEVDFDHNASHLQTLVNESLAPDARDFTGTLVVAQSQQFHFVLSATDWSAPVETGVRMTISDANGRPIFTFAVPDGATRSADVFLDAGRYTVRFTRANEQGGNAQPLLFQLSATVLSDPLGPQLRDTALNPVEASTAPATTALTFYWLPFGAIDLPADGPSNFTLSAQAQTHTIVGLPASLPLAPTVRSPQAAGTSLLAWPFVGQSVMPPFNWGPVLPSSQDGPHAVMPSAGEYVGNMTSIDLSLPSPKAGFKRDSLRPQGTAIGEAESLPAATDAGAALSLTREAPPNGRGSSEASVGGEGVEVANLDTDAPAVIPDEQPAGSRNFRPLLWLAGLGGILLSCVWQPGVKFSSVGPVLVRMARYSSPWRKAKR
jgi:hypothetical protein